jgi:uncharacterized damage-inducible protein DinB
METIADAFDNNARVRARLQSVIEGLSQDQLNARPDGEKWSIQEIVEHIATVEEGTCRICTKLVGEAKVAGRRGNGMIGLSPAFGERSAEIANMKVEAPERVHPKGEATVDESLARMEAASKAFDAIRNDLEEFDLSEHTFPHPFFGQITAAEWLVLAGGHAARHTKQIERLKEKL